MQITKDMLLAAIREKSLREAGRLAGEFARAESEQKESVHAQLEFEKWLVESCDLCLPEDPSGVENPF